MHQTLMELLSVARAALKALPLAAAKRRSAEILNWIKEPVLIVVAVLISTTAIAQPFYVPSGSMEPTLQIGDGLIASKYPYGYSRYSFPFGLGPQSSARLLQKTPERGDVVLFRLPVNPQKTLVKRLIGLPGDRIQMRQGRLWINGVELAIRPAGTGDDEWHDGTMFRTAKYIETLPGGREHPIFKSAWNGPLDDTQVFVVPKNHFFMMGDNRDDSWDSRVDPSIGGVGFVPMENLVGRAEIVVGSYDFLNAGAVWNWLAELRLSRVLTAVR
jgi:signal peptidase I